MNPCVDARHGK